MSTALSKKPTWLGVVILWTMPLLSAAQVNDLDMRLPMDIDADNTTIDGKNSMIIFSGLRLTQGQVSIQADEGRAARMELEDSSWHFTGNVIIDIGAGHIECDAADLMFDEFQLKKAIVTGSPAKYDLQRPGTDEITHAEAGRLSYDVDAGIIEFSEQATIVEGGNQISSNVLVYNIVEQRINAESSGEEDGRVRITYTPANGAESPEDGTDENNDEVPEDENQ
jgi:lipopolysaccharide export system protein LptA